VATTHTKVANSGKMMIARYRIRYFFQKKNGVIGKATGKLACYSISLF